MKTKQILLAAALTTLSVSSVWAQQTLQAQQSEIKFTAKQLGVNVSGQFKQFSADVKLEPKNLPDSRVQLTVDTGSATMFSAEADENLPKPVWFNVAQFPHATFESTAIRHVQGNAYEAAGKLTIKGVSSDVVVPVSLSQEAGMTTVTGKLPIKRLTYKVGENEWADTSLVADEVLIDFKLAITGVDPV